MSLGTIASKALKRIRFEYRSALWWINKLFRKSLTVSTKQGVFTLPLNVGDPIGTSLYFNGEYELDLVTSAMSHIRQLKGTYKGKGTVLDIGANNGVVSIGMLVRGELEGAIAIEPDPRNFSFLEHNVAQNGLESRITCLNYAVSDSKSTLELELSESNYGDHRIRHSSSDAIAKELFGESNREIAKVEANTLDALLADVDQEPCDDISVIWIDVQGYEGYAFAGAKTLLARGIPVVSEIWPYGIQRAGMSQETFCGIVSEIWATYWISREGRFVECPVDTLHTVLEDVGSDGEYTNVIFTAQ